MAKKKSVSFFPAVIKISGTEEIKMIKTVDGLPIGSPFIILKTNKDS